MAQSKEQRLAEVRKRYQEQSGKRAADPNEWKPPKARPGQELNFKFVVLPPLDIGERCVGGKNETNMMGLPTYRGGTHWVNNRPYECPRLHDGEDCAYCQFGFDLLSETEDKDDRRQILRTYVANEFYAVNIYFPPFKSNPPELRGKVMWWKVTQKTVWQKFKECLDRDEDSATGDTPEENKPWGFFYEPDESYVFLLKITSKGEFNNYDGSEFLVSTKGPIIANKAGEPDMEKIQVLLDQRHDLGSKFSARDASKLAEMVRSLENPEPETESSGFDEDELLEDATKTTAKAAAPKATPPSSSDELLDDEVSEPAPQAKAVATKPAKPATAAAVDVDDEEVDSLLAELQDE